MQCRDTLCSCNLLHLGARIMLQQRIFWIEFAAKNKRCRALDYIYILFSTEN